jgi:peroxiredoxin
LSLQPYTPPKPAPTFTLSDLNGTKRTLADFRGKVVLLFFWATW